MQKLTTQQVHSLNRKHGAGLEEGKGKMYVQSFLINSQQNQAGDPHPFRVDDQLLPRLARTAIGMPWLPYPKSDGNHQRPIGASAFTADGIKQHQQQFAGGEIVAQYTNESTGNVNVIIDVFPEYQEAVRSKKIPAFVSPMVFPHEMTPSGLVKEGEILHLQSVHHPGYAPEVAKINSVCEGNGLKQCMTQMKALAASGKLAPFQSKVKNYIAKNVSPADKTQMGKVKIGGETNWYDANKNEFQFSPEYKHNFPNPEKLPIVVQHEIGHMHWHHTLTPAQRKAFAKNVPKDLEISPYAIQHKRMLYKAVSNFRKDKSSKNRKAVKRAYGEYIREVFAILHSMRQEPDYVQRLKTDGLKQGMSAYMGALGAAGPSDADIQKFDKKITKETGKMSSDIFTTNQKPSFGDVIHKTGMEMVLGRHREHPKRTTKIKPSLESVEDDWFGTITKARTPYEIGKARKMLKKIFEANPGLGQMYNARQNAFKKLNSKQRANAKKTPAFWRGFSKDELKDMVKTGKFNSHHEDDGDKSMSMQKNVAENFAWGGILAQYDGDALRKGKSVKPMTYGQHPDKNDDVEWQNKFIGQREALLKHGTDIFDKKGKPKIRHLHFTVKSNKTGKKVQEKYKGVAGKVTYSVKRNARYGVFGAAGPLDDATFNKKVRRVNDSMTKPNRRGHIPNKILKQTDIEDVTRRHASHPKRTPKLNPAKYAPYTPTLKKGDKNWIPAMQMSSTRLSLSQQQLTANKKTFNELIKRNPGLAKTLAAREKVTNSQNRRNQRLFKQAPTLWRGGDEKELEALYKKGHFAGTGGGTGFDFKATSLDKGTAKMFAKGTDPYMMKIDAKPLRDSRLARLVKYSHKPTLEKFGEKYNKPYSDKYLEEKEVRLRPGTPFKFDSGKKLIKQIHFNTSDPKRQKELSAKYGDLAEKITFGDYKALGAKRLGPRHENKKRLKIPGKGLLRRMVKDERSSYGRIIGKDTKRDEPFHGWRVHMQNKLHLASKYYKPDRVRIARIYANDAPRVLQASENWRIPKNYPEKELDEIAINHGKLKTGIKNARAIVDKSKGIKKKPSMTLKVAKPPALPNKMGKLPKKSREEEDKLWNEVSKKYISPYSKENRLKRLLDFVDDGQKPRENEFHPEFKKRNRMGKLGEEGQSDRAAERYKAEQSEDKILTKKNTSAKYRRQVKDDRSAYARKNPKYAALRPELRKHMSLKTRRANKMGVNPNANMIKTAFSNVLGTQTA